MTWLVRILVVLALMAHGAAADVPDKGEPPEGDAEDMSLEEISRMLDNPLGNLWIIFMENDLGRYRGKLPGQARAELRVGQHGSHPTRAAGAAH
jgi:hypothetical protein